MSVPTTVAKRDFLRISDLEPHELSFDFILSTIPEKHKVDPFITLLIVFVLGASTLYPMSRIGSEFMPPLEEGDLLYMPTAEPGLSKKGAALGVRDKVSRRSQGADHRCLDRARAGQGFSTGPARRYDLALRALVTSLRFS